MSQQRKAKKSGPSGSWSEARKLIWRHRYRLIVGFCLLLTNRLVGMILPASSKFLVDDVIGKQRSDLLIVVSAIVGIGALIQAVTSFALSQVLGIAAQGVITEIRRSLLSHIVRLPTRYFDSTQTGVLISRVMSDPEGVRFLVGTGLVQLLGGLVTAVFALAVLIWLNWRLTSVTLGALLVFGVGMTYVSSRLRPLFRERAQTSGEVTGRLSQTLGGIRVVKAYAGEARESLVFTRGAHRLFRNVARCITASSLLSAFTTIIVGSIGVIIMVVGGRSVISGAMTLGELLMYVFFTALLAPPLFELSSAGAQFSEALAGLDRISEVKTMAVESRASVTAAVGEIRGDIAFEGVVFEYNRGVPVLKDISFTASAGSTTALVGPSGSGKSTLISLVMALNHPVSGRITVDGRDLASMPLRNYRKKLGVVLQDNFLFDGSIAENISFACPRAARQQIHEAGRIAHCAEFANTFPDGYDTIVGERGVKLSGGQRQRVAIARAILADPDILILDEATSSLDSVSEAMIREGLRILRRGRTTFVIAHRLSTVESADQILVLDKGEIVENGTHFELVASGGFYSQLYEKQYSMERDRFCVLEESAQETSHPTAQLGTRERAQDTAT